MKIDVTGCFKEQRYKFFESNSQLSNRGSLPTLCCFKEQRYKFFESNSQQRADAILMKNYTDIDKKISALLLKMNQNNALDIERLFMMIEIEDYSRFF